MKKRLSRLISVIVSAAIVFSLIPKIFGTERVRAEASYNIWVGGIQVTGANKDNILYDEKASVKFDPDTYTLTLNEPENMGFYPEIGKEAIVYIGDLGHDITICGKADLVSSGSYYYAVYSDFDSVKVTLNGYFSSGKTFIVNNMNVTGGHIKTDFGIHTEKFNMAGGFPVVLLLLIIHRLLLTRVLVSIVLTLLLVTVRLILQVILAVF